MKSRVQLDISLVRASQTLEEKFPIYARPCIILYESIYNGTIEGLYDMVNA